MSKGKRYALFGAGAAARTVLAEMPSLRVELGPVAAASFKVSTRIANSIKMGFAVRDLVPFNDCEVILLCAPDTGLERAVELLEAAPIEWSGKILLFCVSQVASHSFPIFQKRGASVGSINPVDGMASQYVIEGGREAVKEAKRMVRDLKGKAIELNPDGILLFEAARTLSGSLFTPLVNASVEWLRQSGVESKEAARVAEKMLTWTLRTYLHSGRRGWTGAAANRDWTAIEQQYEAVRSLNPLQGEYFRSTAQHAFALYESYPELARYLPKDDGSKAAARKDEPEP